ncbi:hypothetical protein [uncultured Clostridium sp.]|jgi:hypothetical protein|uniref:hypothetical protein n=1 Tax=uncultured Clostridium sp. TaxID=59620 RepID=UPI002618B8FF|nr:hypothetical protein [uncultured Clostridium sp.]
MLAMQVKDKVFLDILELKKVTNILYKKNILDSNISIKTGCRFFILSLLQSKAKDVFLKLKSAIKNLETDWMGYNKLNIKYSDMI